MTARDAEPSQALPGGRVAGAAVPVRHRLGLRIAVRHLDRGECNPHTLRAEVAPRSPMWSRAVLSAVAAVIVTAPQAQACKLMTVFGGPVSFEPMKDPGQVTVRNDGMSGGEQFGTLRGTLMASREGILVISRDGSRVGIIDPRSGHLSDKGEDDCSRNIYLRSATPAAGIVINGDSPIGTYKGKLPR